MSNNPIYQSDDYLFLAQFTKELRNYCSSKTTSRIINDLVNLDLIELLTGRVADKVILYKLFHLKRIGPVKQEALFKTIRACRR